MEFEELVRARRSVRKFTDEPVSREDLQEVLEDACWAPSGQNLQPWFFQALTKPEDIEWLFRELATTEAGHKKELEERFAKNPEVVDDTLRFMRRGGNANVVILAYQLKPTYAEKDKPSVIESVAAAMNDICLAAWNRGIASCWVEYVTRIDEQIREHFAPDKGPVVGAVVMGYAAMEAKTPRRKDGRFEIR